MIKPILFSLFLLSTFMCVAQPSIDTATIYFPFNQSALTEKAKNILHLSMRIYQTDSIIISAHCDAIGSDSVNDILSQKRAKAVKEYLLQEGIKPTTIIRIHGFGKRSPAHDNNTAENRALNRRAEVLFYIRKGPVDIVYDRSNPDEQKKEENAPNIGLEEEVDEGETFVLKNMNFYGGRHQPLPSSIPVMESLLKWLKRHPTVEIEIQGYVCCTPEGKEGMDNETGKWSLSANRAEVIYNYLVENGIEPERLTYKGYGSKTPPGGYVDNPANRRVEIKIVKR